MGPVSHSREEKEKDEEKHEETKKNQTRRRRRRKRKRRRRKRRRHRSGQERISENQGIAVLPLGPSEGKKVSCLGSPVCSV